MMRRRLKILEYAISSLWRRRYKNLAIIVVFALTISILGSILLLTQSLRFEATEILKDAPDVVVQRLTAGRQDLVPIKLAESIAEIPGVGKVTPRIWGYYFDVISGANYTLMGVDESTRPDMELLEGTLPTAAATCAIGAGVGRSRGVGLGDELILVDSRNVGVAFEVVGLFRSESEILTNDLVVFRDRDLIQFFNFPPGFATDISVQVYNKNEVETVASKIKRDHPETRPITRSEILRTYAAVFNWRSGMSLIVFFAALIAFCILAWDKATGISAEEKREIGILKAVGWETSDILELKFWEGLVISITSFLIGLIVAFVHVFFFGASFLAPILRGWSVLFPHFRLLPHIDLYQLFVMGFLTVVPYIASTVIPSWKAAITDPEEVIRS
jgi:lipoprotein-releasing system permease protein